MDKVREIYHSKNMDVRFLIPVLSGLSKQEVIAVLPKLIRLSPAVVKEVNLKLTIICVMASAKYLCSLIYM